MYDEEIIQSSAVYTAPTTEPIGLEDMKTHLRVKHSHEDEYIAGLITAAREYIEFRTSLQLMTATWEVAQDCFPAGAKIRLPVSPVQSVTHLKYTDADGVEQTVATSVYGVNVRRIPAYIYLKADQVWPTDVLAQDSAVVVRFVAGYTSETAVPGLAKNLIRLLVGHWFSNREAVVVGTIVSNVPETIDMAINLLRDWVYR